LIEKGGKEVKVQKGKMERKKGSKGWKYEKYDSPLKFSRPFPVVDIIREMSKIKHANMKPDD
jgi:hypothetical protein